MIIEKPLMNKKGLTLIEMITALALISIIMLPLTMVVTTGLKTFFVEDENVEVMQNGRVALDRIVDRLREADSVSVLPEGSDTPIAIVIGGNTSYFLSNNKIIESIDGNDVEIAFFVQEFNIGATYDEEDDGVKVLKKLDLEIILKGDKYNQDFHISTSVFLRGR